AATTKVAKESATSTASAERTLTAAATTRTGRRPRESAMPAVGSSVAKTTRPVTAPAAIAWDSDSPRPSCHSMRRPTMNPIGSHRVMVSRSSTRWAARSERCPSRAGRPSPIARPPLRLVLVGEGRDDHLVPSLVLTDGAGCPRVLLEDLPDERLEAGLDLLRLLGGHGDLDIADRGGGAPLLAIAPATCCRALHPGTEVRHGQVVEGV